MTTAGTAPLPTVTAVLRDRSAYVVAFEATQHCFAQTQDALEDEVMGLLLAAAEQAGGEVHVRMESQATTPEPPREFILSVEGETRPVARPTQPAPEVPSDKLADRLGATKPDLAAAADRTPVRRRDTEETEGKTRVRSRMPMPQAPPPGVSVSPVELAVVPQQPQAPVLVPVPAKVPLLDGAPGSATASFLTLHRARELAEWGVRGWFNRTLGLKLGPKRREREERIYIDMVRQPWAGPRTIVILNPKGGSGKTPITILLAAVFGTYGDGSVLAWDNNDTRGTLGWRTEQARQHTAHVRDLLPHTARLMAAQAQAGDLSSFTHRQREDRYDVLRSTPHQLPNQGRLNAEDFDAVHQVASKYYRLIFVDTGNDETAPHWLRAIDRADQIVVATSTRSDRAEAARLMLNSLRERDPRSASLAQNAVVVVSKAARDEPDPAVIAQRFEQQTRRAVAVPFDPAIGADWLRLPALRRNTRLAILRAASAVAEGL